ncbi:MAG: glycosyltransferase [bacterium]
MAEMSIIIPARCEMFLKRTVEDILLNMRGDTEIIVVLDGAPADPPLEPHPKLTVITHEESIGQRAASNEAARLSNAKYICKMDAHCAVSPGFDSVLINDMQPNFCCVPIMRNLHAFDWVCKKCGDRRYQGPTPTSCPKCDNTTEFERDIKWIGKTNPQSTSYCFDSEPHFQYFREFAKRPEGKGDLTETMSLQGSCFMLTRDKYFELNICDEAFGSWGSQGIEVACKTWLSGGRVIVNHKTWYAHMFRTQGGDFGFPYQISGRQVGHAKKTAKDIFFNNKWEKQKYPLSWLLEKFWPVPGWTDAQLADLKKGDVVVQVSTPSVAIPQTSSGEPTKGIVYYTDNRIDDKLAKQVQDTLTDSGLPIVSVSLQPMAFGRNIVLPMERSYLSMFKQILAGIEASNTDIIFLCEHDTIYAKEHFEFTPSNKEQFFYNQNNWQVRLTDGHAVYWECKKVSQICGYRDLMLKHYRERVRRVELEGFTRRMGFEPGTHRRAERVDDTTSEFFETKIPNLDIRHRYNLTQSRWSPTQFRNPCRNWTESHVNKLTGWEGVTL